MTRLTSTSGLLVPLTVMAELKGNLVHSDLLRRRYCLWLDAALHSLGLSRSYNVSRRVRGAALASMHNGAKLNRKSDMNEDHLPSDASESNSDDGFGLPSPIAEPSPLYSFDAKRSPSHGSQILNAALAKAVQQFEERETARIVKDEYSVLDAEGEVVQPSPIKKSKAKAKAKSANNPDADEDYEFV